ncbi:GNAT family N-acetyltransferase [Micromonospora echinofusca]|uniref:GNAT family N-acetyltransferase n=1 Tax=Micromonospora echinofusca TaxID=47858 RepID=A0ABS3W0N1_MICEH|nr:GNAT family N-acetyltransferase [Micromonospora echinofusca]MBO4210344.1 GNAT family N-acetyltransferase [Micromonospora echinofusca]
MADYEVPDRSTLLLRVREPQHATVALTMLHRCLGGSADPGELPGARICTLSDVSSDGRLAPAAAGVLLRHPGEPAAWLAGVAVDLPFRRRGLGRRLLQEICTMLRGEGTERLFVRIPPERSVMIVWLVGQGFRVSPTQPPPDLPSMAATRVDAASGRWLVREL